MKKLTTEEFIKKAKAVHGDSIIYDNVEYVNATAKIYLICVEHGGFWQTPSSHLSGHGCPICANRERQKDNLKRLKKSKESFEQKAKVIHNGKYDYSKFNYINSKTNGEIICHEVDRFGIEHGSFMQSPYAHLIGQGCPKCKSKTINSLRNLKAKISFEEKANSIHDFKYIYHNDYITSREKIRITCPKHGDFYQTPNDHLNGLGCPKCGVQLSKAEDEIIEILKPLEIEQRNRKILNGKELDIYIPSLKLGIEYNGLRWHSEQFGKDKHYHIDKLDVCNKSNIRLIQIFEDEWVNHREICESKLRHICSLDKDIPKIFARKCYIQVISNKEAKEFLTKNHIQGFASSTVYLGCYTSDNHIIGVMSFKKEKNGYWDLNRFATDINYQCIGVGGKLFKYFTQHYYFVEIKSFADRRWTTNPTNNLYTKLGFEFVEFTKPDYRYYNGSNCERHHKFGFRKQILHKRYGLPLTMTEDEMTKELGYTRIWDCGLIKYIYKKH